MTHHCFTQALLERGYLSEQDAYAIYRKITQQNNDRNFDEFWISINKAIECADLKLHRVRYPEDDQRYIGIINTMLSFFQILQRTLLGDEVSKLATTYNAEQIAYFRALLEQIAASEQLATVGLDSRAALNLLVATSSKNAEGTQAGSKSLSVGDRELVLQSLCQDGWMKFAEEQGVYKIGVRTFLELGAYLLKLDPPESIKHRWGDLI